MKLKIETRGPGDFDGVRWCAVARSAAVVESATGRTEREAKLRLHVKLGALARAVGDAWVDLGDELALEGK